MYRTVVPPAPTVGGRVTPPAGKLPRAANTGCWGGGYMHLTANAGGQVGDTCFMHLTANTGGQVGGTSYMHLTANAGSQVGDTCLMHLTANTGGQVGYLPATCTIRPTQAVRQLGGGLGMYVSVPRVLVLCLSWLRLSLGLWRWRWRGERARARVWHMLSIFHVRPDSALMCESDTGHGLRGVTLMDYCCSGPLGWGICIFWRLLGGWRSE